MLACHRLGHLEKLLYNVLERKKSFKRKEVKLYPCLHTLSLHRNSFEMQRLVRQLARSRVIIYFKFLTAMHNSIAAIIESRGDFNKCKP